MRGHIRKRTRDSWSIVIFRGKDATGRRRYKWITIRGKKSDAQRELRRLLLQLDTGTYIDPGQATLAEFLERWLDSYSKHRVGPTTFERYTAIVRSHLTPAIGMHRLDKLRPSHIQDYYSEALKTGRKDGVGGLSPTSVLQHHRVLRQALKQAVKERLLVWNPTDAVSPPRKVHHEVTALTEEQTKQLLEVAESSRVYIPVLLAATTGMRRGEILALRWTEVDLKSGTVAVRYSLEQTKAGLAFKQPKTASGRREVVLPEMTVAALSDHRIAQKRVRLAAGPAFIDNDLVSPSPDGSPWAPNSFSSTFKMLLRRKQLPYIRFHDLRHTHATLLLRQGVHPKVVSERLGHSTIGITLDIYSHVLPGMQEEAARRINRALHS